jgi:hypothetical protein
MATQVDPTRFKKHDDPKRRAIDWQICGWLVVALVVVISITNSWRIDRLSNRHDDLRNVVQQVQTADQQERPEQDQNQNGDTIEWRPADLMVEQRLQKAQIKDLFEDQDTFRRWFETIREEQELQNQALRHLTELVAGE